MEFVLLLFLLILAIREERKGRYRRTDTEMLRNMPPQQHVRILRPSAPPSPVSSEIAGSSLSEAVSAAADAADNKDVVGEAA